MFLELMLATTLSATDATPPRAEICLARIEDLIIEASQETGRVAGPSWFIRDWWLEKADEAEKPLTREQRAALVRQVAAERTATPDAAASARSDCVQEAIDAGAVPGI